MVACTTMRTLDSSFRGITAVYKPKGPSSHDMIYRLRRLTGEKRVGHAGTLDPLASGILVIAISREYTKQLGQFLKQDKEYEAEIIFGATSTTDDADGEISFIQVREIPKLHKLSQTISHFVGEIWQTPPDYSAVKIKGKTAYRLAREGKSVTLEPRQRQVRSIEILEYHWPLLRLRIVTGSGVYIRSLARDIGQELKIGGYLTNLVRTRVGQYTIKDCYQVD